ncbi:MAG: sulfite exporter TauE/SafE family protein [Ignavibacteriae bacterium]|nr:sulfite exporter TauE/SafE family protein [Ignavibacteriota bacterium]
MDYWLSFIAGLFGSMHCVGMCGMIVMGYSTQGIASQPSTPYAFAAHITYNAGRVLSYAIVGGILGSLGAGIATLQDIAFGFSVVAGSLLLLLGISLLRIIPSFATSATLALESRARNMLFRIYQAVYGSLIAQQGLESKFYIGLLTPLLPCGLLYSMFLKAASTASLLQGALVMASFGAGIVPALVITGFASSYFWNKGGNKLRYWGDKIAAITIIAMGLALLWRAFVVPEAGGHGQHM